MGFQRVSDQLLLAGNLDRLGNDRTCGKQSVRVSDGSGIESANDQALETFPDGRRSISRRTSMPLRP